jgi:hypothetical protein
MIDRLPLDLFGEDEPEPATTDQTTVASTPAADPVPEAAADADADPAATVSCPWCAATVPADLRTCPACDATIPVPESPAPAPVDGICQWCGATIAPDVDICPDCGWDARGDSQVELPGLTTPLSEEQIRSLYGGDPEPEIDDSIALAADIISLILPRG